MARPHKRFESNYRQSRNLRSSRFHTLVPDGLFQEMLKERLGVRDKIVDEKKICHGPVSTLSFCIPDEYSRGPPSSFYLRSSASLLRTRWTSCVKNVVFSKNQIAAKPGAHDVSTSLSKLSTPLQMVLLLLFFGWAQGMSASAEGAHPTTHQAVHDQYLEKCRASPKDALACYRVGKYHQHGIGGVMKTISGVPTKSARSAGVFYELACWKDPFDRSKGVAQAAACAQLGGLYFDDALHIPNRNERERNGEKLHITLGNTYFQAACDGGDWVGCSNLANSYRRGRGVDVDLQRAAQLYERGCQNGLHALPCLRQRQIDNQNLIDSGALSWGQMRDDDIRIKRNRCFGIGDGRACFAAAALLRYTISSENRDMDEVMRLFTHGCENKSVEACYTLGVLHEEGRVIEADIPTAFSYYKQACQADALKANALACPSFEAMSLNQLSAGATVQSASTEQTRYTFQDGEAAYEVGDFGTALNIWRALAQNGDADAQFRTAIMYGRGEGTDRNDTQSEYWFRQATNQGLPAAELNLGVFLINDDRETEALNVWATAGARGNTQAAERLAEHVSNSLRWRAPKSAPYTWSRAPQDEFLGECNAGISLTRQAGVTLNTFAEGLCDRIRIAVAQRDITEPTSCVKARFEAQGASGTVFSLRNVCEWPVSVFARLENSTQIDRQISRTMEYGDLSYSDLPGRGWSVDFLACFNPDYFEAGYVGDQGVCRAK